MIALAASCAIGATTAHAQHVVTEAEASKLTLAALTAPPPPPRPMWRNYVHRAMARGYAAWHHESAAFTRWRSHATTVASHRVVHRSGSAHATHGRTHPHA